MEWRAPASGLSGRLQGLCSRTGQRVDCREDPIPIRRGVFLELDGMTDVTDLGESASTLPCQALAKSGAVAFAAFPASRTFATTLSAFPAATDFFFAIGKR